MVLHGAVLIIILKKYNSSILQQNLSLGEKTPEFYLWDTKMCTADQHLRFSLNVWYNASYS